MSTSNAFMAYSVAPLYRTCLTWNIDHFSYCLKEELNSPTFTDEQKNGFSLMFHPAIDGYHSLEICLVTEGNIFIKANISLVDSRGVKCLTQENSGDVFKTRPNTHHHSSPFERSLTVEKFISTVDLLDPSNGYLPGDTLTLHCEILNIDNGHQNAVSIMDPKEIELASTQKALADYGTLLKTGYLSDISLLVGEKTFLAHKLILSARSSVFAAMFTHDSVEKQKSRVEIPDVSPETFEAFLTYLYTGTLTGDLEDASAEKLLVVADKYGIEQLKSMCEEYLITRVNCIERAPNLLLFAKSVNAHKLRDSVLEFIRNRPGELLEGMLKEPDQLMNMCQYLADQNEPKNEEVQEKKGEKRKRQVEVEDTLQ